ncbi:MAG: response regulator [Limnochordaceae bacterium]|nr:response regulator [Limnochordaceae bacterium]
MRQMIRRILTEHGFTVVGIARNGQEAVDGVLRLRPDVVTLDVEMPVKDGLQALTEIMHLAPVPVLMVSHLTAREAPATVEALARGAVDVVLKPGYGAGFGAGPAVPGTGLGAESGAGLWTGSVFRSLAAWEEELVRKVRLASHARPRSFRQLYSSPASTLSTASAVPTAPGLPPSTAPPALPTTASGNPPPAASATPGGELPLVVIGASTGGPGTLSEIFAGLSPTDLPAAVLVVQHMPPGFTHSLAQRLDRLSRFRVMEAYDGAPLEAGVALVAPGGRHMVLRPSGRRIALVDTPPRHGVRPAIDTTLESVAAEFHGPVVAAILTGMGADGAAGARQVRRHGAKVIAQDEATSVVYGMPKVVAEWGEADRICPLPEIPATLSELVNQLLTRAPSQTGR